MKLSNPEAARFFVGHSAHSDVGDALVASLKKLGDYEVRGELQDYKAPYVVTASVVFCGAAGSSDTFWRLRAQDHKVALATGAFRSDIGPEWVRIELFRSNWPQPDLSHWALRAYDFARTGH